MSQCVCVCLGGGGGSIGEGEGTAHPALNTAHEGVRGVGGESFVIKEWSSRCGGRGGEEVSAGRSLLECEELSVFPSFVLSFLIRLPSTFRRTSSPQLHSFSAAPLFYRHPSVFRIPSFRTKSCVQRSFSYQAPIVWNQLPVSIRHSTSVSSFRSPLKAFLFFFFLLLLCPLDVLVPSLVYN